MRRRLLVVNQYYWPGVEATAYLLTQLCEELAHDWDVTVIAGLAPGAEPGTKTRNAVRIVHLPSTVFSRRRMGLRALNYLTYLALAAARGLRAERPDVVLSMTDPPFVGAVGRAVARRFDVPFVLVSQDVFPETAVAAGAIRSRPAVAAIDALVGLGVRHADRVVAIGETMRARLDAKGVPPERIRVISNWADTNLIEPAPRDNEWAKERGLAGGFVAAHFGNLGYAQDLDTLIQAATHVPEVRFVIGGRGAREAELRALASRLGAANVLFVEHQPRERLSLVLSSADVHVVGLARGMAGYVVPSRLYSVLAAGRPVVAAAEEESETAQLVREVGCGVVIPPGDPERLAQTLESAAAGDYDLDAMGRRGRDYVVREASLEVAASRYRALLDELTG